MTKETSSAGGSSMSGAMLAGLDSTTLTIMRDQINAELGRRAKSRRMAKRQKRGPKRTVEFNGRTYSVRSDSIEIPDLAGMERLAALMWLNANTYASGYSVPKVNLRGLGSLLSHDSETTR